MKNIDTNKSSYDLNKLCVLIRGFIVDGEYDACMEPICKAMESYPDAPHPHNLLGILLEKKGEHAAAMKHFRAAWALDPNYLPAKHNLETYGTFISYGTCAYDEGDVRIKQPKNSKIVIDGGKL